MAEAIALPGSPGRSDAGARSQQILARLKSELAALAGVRDPRRVILTPGCTWSLHMAIHGALRREPGERAIAAATSLEHASVSKPLEALARRGELTLRRAGCGASGLTDPDELLAAARDDAAAVFMTAVSNVAGTIQPVAEVSRRLRERAFRGLLVVDAAQAAGVVPLAVDELGIDVLVFGGHKSLRGPAGIGALVLGERCARERRLEPVMLGGTGGDAIGDELRELEPGTSNVPAAAGLLAAITRSGRPDPSALLAYERGLARQLCAGLRTIRGVRVLGTPEDSVRTGCVAFTTDWMAPADLAAALGSSFGITVRGGMHCAPWAHEALGTSAAGGAVRASVGETTSEADVGAFVDAVGAIARDS